MHGMQPPLPDVPTAELPRALPPKPPAPTSSRVLFPPLDTAP